MKKEIKNMLGNILDPETADSIFNNMFPEPITGYKKGKIYTFGELKNLPDDTIVHIYYTDEDGELRADDFLELGKFDEDEYYAGAFPFPVKGLTNDTLMENLNNSDWTFTIREAIPVKSSAKKPIKKK